MENYVNINNDKCDDDYDDDNFNEEVGYEVNTNNDECDDDNDDVDHASYYNSTSGTMLA